MKWFPYPYESQLDGVMGVAHRPIIEINIAKDGSNIFQLGLVDSGSDRTIISIDIAKAIKIDLSKCKEIRLSGIGSVKGFLCDVELTIPDFGKIIPAEVIFAENIPFGVLLGQRDFFKEFHVRFEKDQNTFYLALPPKKAASKQLGISLA